jgi:hypothetical protein
MKLIFKNLPKTKIALLAILAFSLLLISISSAIDIENPIASTSDIYTLVIKILNFLIILAIPLTAILVIYAGLLYITSAGNAEKIKTAQKTLIWALIGFAIVLIAKSVPAIIQEFLSGKEESPAEAPAGAPGAPAEPAEPDSGGTSAPTEPDDGGTDVIPDNGPGGGGGAGVIPDESGGGGGVDAIPDESGGGGGVDAIPDESGGGGGADVIPDESGGGGGADVIPTSGTYKTCRKPASGSWAWLTGNANTLYCKEATWTGENPGDECSILNEVCQGGAGAF